ncbi:MAG: sigma-70 family RNA polymerase sigma factor, partial [Firmicutes bacterium]|nr:sigma-70 family RNA polymerase sigma factor [Bacillota bacterium]
MTAAEQAKLYLEYRTRVMGYIKGHISNMDDAEDICQDVFEKVFKHADRYDAERSAPGTWIYAITRNSVIDYWRRNRPSEELPEDLSDDSLPEDGVIQTELLETLAAALERLPGELTDIIVLRYYDGLPLTEIAETLGMSYGMVKIRHNKALSLLR